MIPLTERRTMTEPGKNSLSLAKQCNMLSIHRSGLYYKPRPISGSDHEVMLEIDKLHIKDPTLGTRRMSAMLKQKGYDAGRDKARSLMRKMRIKTVYCRPRTTIIDPARYKYPYLLSNLKISRPNQVWGIDITYIPMRRGFMYMVAIIDIYSRYIVNWGLSNTMEAEWVVKVVAEAIQMHGKPDILNSDQGSQFTSDLYIDLLKDHKIKISMDGKGRAIDNVYIERFWRTIKYDKIYLNPVNDGIGLYTICQEFINYYNQERLHESLGYQPPIKRYRDAA